MAAKKEKWMLITKKADFKSIAENYNMDQVTARIMRNREIVGQEAMDKYLHGTLENLYSPFLLKDMDKLTDILIESIKKRKKVRVIGDYDIDGIQSAYILHQGIKRAGGLADVAIPHRIKDGYGINENLITQAKEEGIDTIITCDNGIAAIDEIAYAKELGMTVLVTDHHDVPYEEIDKNRVYKQSKADAVVNPKQEGCKYPFSGICGAVVAFKTIMALYQKLEIGEEEAISEFLEHAAFATVGDVMELVDENRIIVKYGIRQMKRTNNQGLFALMQQKNIPLEKLSAYHLGFVLGPCLNASGRLDTAKQSLELMQVRDESEAAVLAILLSDLNEERKRMTTEGIERAKELIEKEHIDKDKVMLVYIKELHESLAGIVAGRIRESYHKPVFVLTQGEEGVKGSGRSIEAYSMYEEMCRCQELFEKFGGHPMAAGLSMKEENVASFREKINEYCNLKEEDFIPKIYIDVPMPLGYVTKELIRQFKVLEPFGKGNQKPVFADKNIIVKSKKIIGKNQNVLKLQLADDTGRTYDGIYFGDVFQMMEFLEDRDRISIIYYPEINTYMGQEEIQIIVSNYC